MRRLIEVLAVGVTDDSGLPVENGTVTFYDAGTSNLRTVYQDFAETSTLAHANPATLDAAGRLIAYSSYRVKLVIRTSTGATVRTIDNVGTADSDLGSASASTLAGNGLTAPGDGTIAVNPDGTTLEISSDTLRVKDLGVKGLKRIKTAVSKVFADTPYTSTTADDVIFCNATGGAITVNLPTAGSITGKVFRIKKTDSSANAVTIDGSGSETVGGLATVALKSQGAFIEIISDGTNWLALQYYNYVTSTTSSGTFSTTSASATDVTNVTATLDVLGGRVDATLFPDGTTNQAQILMDMDGSDASASATLYFIRGSTDIGRHIATFVPGLVVSGHNWPCGGFQFTDYGPTAAQYAYKYQVSISGANTISVRYCKLRLETRL